MASGDREARDALANVLISHIVVDENPFITCLCGQKWMTTTEHAKHIAKAILASDHDAQVRAEERERIAVAIEHAPKCLCSDGYCPSRAAAIRDARIARAIEDTV